MAVGESPFSPQASVDPWSPNLNRILPLRFDFKDCSNASLNCSSGYTCSTAAESEPSASYLHSPKDDSAALVHDLQVTIAFPVRWSNIFLSMRSLRRTASPK